MSESESDEEGDEWRFTLEDIERREAEREAAVQAAAERNEPLEPGEPTLEGALFVILGMAIAAFALSRLFV